MARTLLPPGCYDLLPPYARLETALLSTLLSTFESYGYAEVSPPMIEYAESLLAGRGAALAGQVFRLMDAATHEVMGLRADITLQIARIASSRLSNAPLPLRLSYAGPVLRARRKNRGSTQHMQAGIELIGPESPEADAEVISVACEALQRAGLKNFSVDLNMPGIVMTLLAKEALDNATLENLMQAVEHKDVSTIAAFPIAAAKILSNLVACTGPAEEALKQLQRIALPPEALELSAILSRVAKLVQAGLPKTATLTVDVTESRGLEYHTGVTYSFFAEGARDEIGSGGRYLIDDGHFRRDATGCTLYTNAFTRLIPEPPMLPKVFIAADTDAGTLAALHDKGFITVRALPGYERDHAAAVAQGCTHYFNGKKLEEL